MNPGRSEEKEEYLMDSDCNITMETSDDDWPENEEEF